ncbi:MAG: hypothetical protein AAF722_12405 [Cyanobacteria bacterium P01_C01_bin.70]
MKPRCSGALVEIDILVMGGDLALAIKVKSRQQQHGDDSLRRLDAFGKSLNRQHRSLDECVVSSSPLLGEPKSV